MNRSIVVAIALGVMLTGVGQAASAPKPKATATAPVGTPAAVPSAPSKAVTAAQANADPFAVIKTFTVADIQAALDDARAQTPPDITAATCYAALLPIVEAGVQNPLPAGLGAFQALQKARDAKALLANIQSPNGPLGALNTACAPLVLDAQNTMVQLGLKVGSVVAGGAAVVGTGGLALPALPLFALPFGF